MKTPTDHTIEKPTTFHETVEVGWGLNIYAETTFRESVEVGEWLNIYAPLHAPHLQEVKENTYINTVF